jgi:phage-related tail fiber protein
MQFNLPDLRGRFVRGWDHGAGHDPEAGTRTSTATGGNTGDAVGTQQGDELQSHTHGVNDPGHLHSLGHRALPIGTGGLADYWGPFGDNSGTTLTATTGVTIQASGGAETRPLNIAVNYIIKL